MADKNRLLGGAGLLLALSNPVWAELPDVETIPLNQPSISERLSAESPYADNQLQRKVEILQTEVQDLRGLVEEQSYLIQQLSEKQKTLYLDLDKRISGGTTASVPTDVTQVIRADSTSDISAANMATELASTIPDNPVIQNEAMSYKHAFNLIQAKDYTNAIKALENHLVQYPNGQYTPNVYYWLGEVSIVVKNYEQAAVNFHKVLDYYPLHAKASDSLLKLGFVSFEQGNLKEASQLFQDVQTRFPDSSAARLAGSKLQQMRQSGQI